MIDIGKGKGLELSVLLLAELRAQSLPCQSREAGAADSQHQRTQGTAHHQHALPEYIRPVAVCHPYIDDIRHDEGNDDFKKRFRQYAEYRQNGILFVLVEV